jgi:hypothetical protein
VQVSSCNLWNQENPPARDEVQVASTTVLIHIDRVYERGFNGTITRLYLLTVPSVRDCLLQLRL